MGRFALNVARFTMLLLIGSLVSACGGGGFSPHQNPISSGALPLNPASGGPGTSHSTLYVGVLQTDEHSEVLVYKDFAQVNPVLDLGFLSGQQTSEPLAVDSHGTVFASFSRAVNETEVDAFPSGRASPANTFSNSDNARAIVVDSSDDVYIVQPNEIQEFAPGEYTTPLRVLSPPHGLQFAPGFSNAHAVVVDAHKNVYALASSFGCVTTLISVYGPSGTSPMYQIQYNPPSPAAPGFGVAEVSMAVDSTGELYVAGFAAQDATRGYGPGQSVPNLTLPSAFRVAVGPDDNVFLLEDVPHPDAAGTSEIDEYAARSTTLLGSAPNSGKIGRTFAVDPEGVIYRDGGFDASDVLLVYPSIGASPFELIAAANGNFPFIENVAIGPP